MAQLITADPRSLVPQLALAGTGFQQGQQISAEFANRQALAAQEGRSAAQEGRLVAQDVREEDVRENEVLTRTALDALSIKDQGERRAFLTNQRDKFRQEGRDTTNIDRALSLDDAGLNRLVGIQARQGQELSDLFLRQFPSLEQQVLLRRVAVEEARETRAGVEGRSARPVEPTIPEVLLSGLSSGISAKASASFSAAGGGEKGLKAFAQVVDKATEQERRLSSPAIIQSSFPNATPAEVVQLQATMDAARTTETGLKAAKDVREAQRTTKKAKSFQKRGVTLLNSILDNDQLGDVLGSIEGAIDFRLSDSESELIDDINEVGDILTADNLNLMSGVLSESDIKILRALAGGGLKRTRTEERFRKDVTALRDKLGASEVLTADDIQQGRDGTVPNVNEKGFRLMVDAQGNRAFVGPNGEIEEVQ